MQLIQSSPRFPDQRLVGRNRRCPWRPATARRRGAAGSHHFPAAPRSGHLPRPWDIAEDLLRVEGFTDIRYVPAQIGPELMQMLGRGDLDFGH